MCGSMVDIQSPAAEIRRGKKIERKIVTTGQKYNAPLLHRAAITSGQSKLTKGRTAAAHGRSNRIRQVVAPVCTPQINI